RRSSGRFSTDSRSCRSRRRWSATRPTTTSPAPAPSACRPGSSTARVASPTLRIGSTISAHSPLRSAWCENRHRKMPDWVIWVIVAVGLALGELATPGLFFLGPVALAAIPAAIAAALGADAWIQVLVFIVGSLASLAVLRPIARAHLRMPALARTGTAALVGARATVLQRVDAEGGRVRIGGEEGSARAYMEDQVLEPGTRVEVAKIEGATALVYE